MRLGLLIGSLLLALALGVWGLQSPAPRPADAPATAFSAARAQADVEAMAVRPHPVGSVEHGRVRDLLLARMADLGLSPQVQTGPLSPAALRRLEQWGGAAPAAGVGVQNLVGVLPGSDPAQPAVLMMAHYDSVPDSPGAADDAAGVAAILESVRALQARGPIPRTLVVLLTDAEELNLDGARLFFAEHPYRDRIGAVINLEARGGGGRALMFETGQGPRRTLDLFARAAARADGGATANSLTAVMYALMPNGTDFTIARDRGIQGLNFAFLGRPDQYHAPSSTPAALDPGALQHLGSQALETADQLLKAPTVPPASGDVVYADLFGRVIVRHTPEVGWGLWAVAVALGGFAAVRVRRSGGGREAVSLADVGRGALSGLGFVAAGLVAVHLTRALAGPPTSGETYYLLLRRLPWMEGAAVLAAAAVALLILSGRPWRARRWLAGGTAVGGAAAILLGGPAGPLAVATPLAVLWLWFGAGWPRSLWGAWLGPFALIVALAGVLQAAAPGAAFLLIWPALATGLAMAVAALIDVRLERPAALLAPAIAVVLVAGWLIGYLHLVFLGVGVDLPAAILPLMLLMLTAARPLGPAPGRAMLASRPLALAALACLVIGGGLAVSARTVQLIPQAPVSAAP